MFRSKPGKPCTYLIKREDVCKKAATFFPGAVYTIASGNGFDLPYGCISDKTRPGYHYIYWNPSGAAISDDPNIQSICQSSKGILSGRFLNYWRLKITISILCLSTSSSGFNEELSFTSDPWLPQNISI